MPQYATADPIDVRCKGFACPKEKLAKRYSWPAQYLTPHDSMDKALRGWRRDAIKEREESLAVIRDHGRKCPAGAGLLKEYAKRMLRLQRACTLALPWVGTPDKNQEPQAPILWPLDLASELDEIAGRLEMLP